jgi:hypothetical protein
LSCDFSGGKDKEEFRSARKILPSGFETNFKCVLPNSSVCSAVPPVQFNSAGDGGMHIGQPTPAVSNPQYENPEAIRDGVQHGFVNQGKQCIYVRGFSR